MSVIIWLDILYFIWQLYILMREQLRFSSKNQHVIIDFKQYTVVYCRSINLISSVFNNTKLLWKCLHLGINLILPFKAFNVVIIKMSSCALWIFQINLEFKFFRIWFWIVKSNTLKWQKKKKKGNFSAFKTYEIHSQHDLWIRNCIADTISSVLIMLLGKVRKTGIPQAIELYLSYFKLIILTC